MKAVIFDVDNTLYDSAQYFSGAFRNVALYLSEKYDLPKQEIFEQLMNIWKKNSSMYPHIFDDILEAYEISEDVMNIVNIFNSYSGILESYPGTHQLLTSLKERELKLGIVTDGTAIRQKRKIHLLGLEKFFDSVVYTSEIGHSKLTEYPFRKVLADLDVIPKYSIYVGDNPHLDFKGAKDIGILTIRLLKGDFKLVPKDKYIDHEINELRDLTGFL
ncbi:MAG: HAD family hydrolase [Candidatus Thorarchaeota archaeon]